MSAMNLRESQLQMVRHLRNPESAAPPDGVEERRLKIYRELIYNNVEGFISGGFPVLHSLYSDVDWHALVREFLDAHRCRSPYFLEISQEFIQYLLEEHQPRDCDPPFLAELAHYEWVELALDVSEEELPPACAAPDPEHASLRLSPLAWVLSYRFPVHRIGPGNQPREAGEPTFLAVYRDREDQVRFVELNAATARLLELLRESEGLAFDEVLAQLAGELQADPAQIRPHALGQLREFLDLGVVVQA